MKSSQQKIKIGDLVRAVDDQCVGDPLCWCFYCSHGSNRIGVVFERLNETDVEHSAGYWAIMFDIGEWRAYGKELEVINEAR